MNRKAWDKMHVEGQRIGSQAWSSALSLLLTFVLISPFQGCCAHFDRESATEDRLAGTWIRNWEFRYDWQETKSWTEVDGQRISQAVGLLREKPFIPLTASQVSHLAKVSTPHAGDSIPYLVRAVGPSGGQFPPEVYIRPGGDVWVAGGAVGRCPIPRRRLAVIAWLGESPHDVYSTFSLAK